MTTQRTPIGKGYGGSEGMPGDSYCTCRAKVYELSPGRYELAIKISWGSNQGHLEEHDRVERRVRADSLHELAEDIDLDNVPSWISDGETMGEMRQAIRDAIYEAEDSLAAQSQE